MKQFVVTVKHDTGLKRIRVTASDEAKARELVMIAEGCPESAIVKVRKARYTVNR